MITGCESITYELTDYEKDTLVPILVRGFHQMVGKKNAFTNIQCTRKLISLGHECNDARFRKLVHYIRQNHLVPGLIGTKCGYYKAANKEELSEYLDSVKERKRSIEEIITALENDLEIF
jgi:hypothetical protein